MRLPFHTRSLVVLAAAALVVLATACASTRVSSPEEEPGPAVRRGQPSSIEISYLRGLSAHRLRLSDDGGPGGKVEIESYSDKQLLRRVAVSWEKFEALYRRSATIVATLQSQPAARSEVPCHSPFTLVLREQANVRSVEGCRAQGEGRAIGRLLKEIEHLMVTPP